MKTVVKQVMHKKRQRVFSLKSTGCTNPPKVSIRPFKPKYALQYLFVHESHLHNHVYFNVSHIHAAANSCADACIHVLHREKHAPPCSTGQICGHPNPPDCPNDIKACNQRWTHIHPGEGRVPYEINTDKYSKESAALTRMLQITKSVRTDLDDSWKSLHAVQNLVGFCCFHPQL